MGRKHKPQHISEQKSGNLLIRIYRDRKAADRDALQLSDVGWFVVDGRWERKEEKRGFLRSTFALASLPIKILAFLAFFPFSLIVLLGDERVYVVTYRRNA